MKPLNAKPTQYLFLATYGIMAALLYWSLPLFGDDAGYITTFASFQGFGTGIWPLSKTLNAIIHHWLYVNGRFANYLAIFLIPIQPQWLLAIIIGFIDSLMLYGILKICHLWGKTGSITLSALIIGICFFTFQWWDVTFVDCNLCYVWATTFGLLFMLLLRDCRNLHGFRKFLLLLFSFIAGGMHEAVGAPICGALIIFYIFSPNRKAVTRQQIQMVITFGIATLTILISPAAWSRVSNLTTPDDPLLLLLLKSEPIAILMVAIFAILLIIPKSRHNTISLLKSNCSFWVMATLFSTVFVAVGGKVGRAGWFAQTSALIALIYLIQTTDIHISRRIGAGIASIIYIAMATLGTAIGIHCYNAAQPDLEMRKEMAQEKTMLFYTLSDYDMEPWWTLGRVHVMKCYDDYSRAMLVWYYKLDKLPKILPADAKDMDLDNLHTENMNALGCEFNGINGTYFADGSVIAESIPASALEPLRNDWYPHDKWTINTETGRFYAVEFDTPAGKRLYHITKWIPEPGER